MGATSTDPFQPIADKKRIDRRFLTVATSAAKAPARAMLRRVFADFVDADGNFLEQFQTSGFDARTWELALFAYLGDAGFNIDRTHTSPDFLCEKGGAEVAIEATTANPSGGVATPITLEGLRRRAEEPEAQTLERIQHEIPIRFGSALFSKLGDHYWERPQIADRPLVFAIESFASEDALQFSDTALASYLYGTWATPSRNKDGDLIVTTTPVEEHKVGEKVIPSSFFDQPNADHVSAVLFSNSGTISKFNRMGLQEGLDATRVWMLRYGTYYHHDPNASEPLEFAYNVAERINEWGFGETWGEGMAMFHNPNALAPIPDELFPQISHHHFEDGQVVSTIPFFHPYASQSIVGLGKPPAKLMEVLARRSVVPRAT